MRLRHEIKVGKAYKTPNVRWFGKKGHEKKLTIIEKESIILLLKLYKSKDQWSPKDTLFDFTVFYDNQIINFTCITVESLNKLKLIT